jgi:hypothetical protein
MTEWISVEERLPDLREPYKGSRLSSEPVLIWNGHYVSVGEYEETYKTRKLRWLGRYGRITKVTHWQPLPARPKASHD